MGEVVPARTFADPTSPIPSHCTVIILFQSVACSASIVVTSTVRVNVFCILPSPWKYWCLLLSLTLSLILLKTAFSLVLSVTLLMSTVVSYLVLNSTHVLCCLLPCPWSYRCLLLSHEEDASDHHTPKQNLQLLIQQGTFYCLRFTIRWIINAILNAFFGFHMIYSLSTLIWPRIIWFLFRQHNCEIFFMPRTLQLPLHQTSLFLHFHGICLWTSYSLFPPLLVTARDQLWLPCLTPWISYLL